MIGPFLNDLLYPKKDTIYRFCKILDGSYSQYITSFFSLHDF